MHFEEGEPGTGKEEQMKRKRCFKLSINSLDRHEKTFEHVSVLKYF